MTTFSVGETITWTGFGDPCKVQYRGMIDRETACVLMPNGIQTSAPVSQLAGEVRKPVMLPVGDMVFVTRENGDTDFGVVVEHQGMFYLVEVDGKVEHFHRSQVTTGY